MHWRAVYGGDTASGELLDQADSTCQLSKGDGSLGTSLDRQSKIITLILDEFGLLRVGGRLQEVNWSYSQKHPCILPGNDKFSELLIQRAHREVMHSGLQATLNQLRETYWIRARQMMKNVV